MKRTGIVVDSRYQNHITPSGHLERPERIATLVEHLEHYKRDGLVRLQPRSATAEEILANHDPSHLQHVEATTGMGYSSFDPDTHASDESYETALLAAGGFLAVIDAIVDGRVDNGFALVRPPGHHAEADRAMGFCLFNNVASGAHYLRRKHGLERVLIVDWDVHHGNGTQHSFYDDSGVLFISTHRYPFYPGTGAADECGVSNGMGFTVNLPLPPGLGDDEYVDAFRRVVDPVSRQFDPQFVLVSAGFDHHAFDPLGGMQVTGRGVSATTRVLMDVARDHCDGHLAAVLEGGYSLEALRESVTCVLDEMGESDGDLGGFGGGGADDVLALVERVQKRFWKLA